MEIVNAKLKKLSCHCGLDFSAYGHLIGHINREHDIKKVKWTCDVCSTVHATYKKAYDCYYRKHVSKGHKLSVSVVQVTGEGESSAAVSDYGEGHMGESGLAGVIEEHEREPEEIANEQPARGSVDVIKAKLLELSVTLATKFKVNENALDYLFKLLDEVQGTAGEGNVDKKFPFADLSTYYRRQKMLCEEVGLVKPVGVSIAQRAKRRADGKIGAVSVKGYFVPIKENLEFILKNRFIYEAVRLSQDDVNKDMWEIRLAVSIDDVEFANPLGQAKTQHKQTIASFQLLNLPESWRSLDVSKHLLFLCNSKDFKRYPRADEVLFQDLKAAMVESETGVKLIDGSHQCFRIKLVYVVADAEAMCNILKVKMTGAKTIRPCWNCFIHHDEMDKVFDTRAVPKRRLDLHNEVCHRIDDQSVRKKARMELSTKSGVKGTAAITLLPGFSFDDMLFDPMHCVLEGGILELGILDFIRQLTSGENGLKLKEVNVRIANWNYKLRVGESKPIALPSRVMEGGSLGVKAQTCWTLAENLLFIFRDKEEAMAADFKQFAKCLRISQAILNAPAWSPANVECLRIRLMDFLIVRLSLYPWATMTPKCHFVLHFPDQILRHGASRFTSCLQFERHYKTIKAKRLNCWLNPSLTLGKFHQTWQVRALYHPKNGKWESRNLDQTLVGAQVMQWDELPEDARDVYEDNFYGCKVFKKVTYGTCEFKCGDFVDCSDCRECTPRFHQIMCFVFQQERCIAVARSFNAFKYNVNYGCFECRPCSVTTMEFDDMDHKFSLPYHKVGSTWFVNRKYSAAV